MAEVGPVALGRLHLITDTRPGRDAVSVVTGALAVGVPVIQVRVERSVTDREAYALALRIVELCVEHQATCLINDRLDIALAIRAHGVHVGVDDLPVSVVRELLGPDAIVGATVRDPATARALQAAGASYLGVGPAYKTGTKPGLPEPLGPTRVGVVAAAVDVPVIAIGGVTAERVPELLAAGAYGVAVVGAISEADDPAEAAAAFLEAIEKG